MSYIISQWSRDLNTDFTLDNCFFGSVKSPPRILIQINTNIVVFGADMSSSMHIDNKNKDFSALSEGPTQGLDDTILTAEAKYPINFTQSGKKSC